MSASCVYVCEKERPFAGVCLCLHHVCVLCVCKRERETVCRFLSVCLCLHSVLETEMESSVNSKGCVMLLGQKPIIRQGKAKT